MQIKYLDLKPWNIYLYNLSTFDYKIEDRLGGDTESKIPTIYCRIFLVLNVRVRSPLIKISLSHAKLFAPHVRVFHFLTPLKGNYVCFTFYARQGVPWKYHVTVDISLIES